MNRVKKIANLSIKAMAGVAFSPFTLFPDNAAAVFPAIVSYSSFEFEFKSPLAKASVKRILPPLSIFTSICPTL